MGRVSYDYSGKTVLVTSASRRIDYAVAEAFLRAGTKLYVLSSGNGIAKAANKLAPLGDVTPLQADITNSAALAEALADVVKLDVLINNAGLEQITALEDPNDEVENSFRRIIDINVNGTFLVTRHAVSKMSRDGRTILTASIWSRTAVPDFSAYVVSKHANLGFMRSISHELGLREITVNAVCPGWVKTDTAMLSLKKIAKSTGRSEANLLREITDAQVLGGLLQPKDLASLYLFLASKGDKDITGQAYMLDRREAMA